MHELISIGSALEIHERQWNRSVITNQPNPHFIEYINIIQFWTKIFNFSCCSTKNFANQIWNVVAIDLLFKDRQSIPINWNISMKHRNNLITRTSWNWTMYNETFNSNFNRMNWQYFVGGKIAWNLIKIQRFIKNDIMRECSSRFSSRPAYFQWSQKTVFSTSLFFLSYYRLSLSAHCI